MNYCGIDLAGVSSYVYVTDDRGSKARRGRGGYGEGGIRAAVEAVRSRRALDRD